MKKRVLALLLAVFTLSALFTGCTNQASGDDSSTNSPAAASPDTSTPAPEETNDTEPAEVTTIYASTKGYPSPYMIVGEDNELSGYDIEVLQEVFNRLPQYELEFVLAEGDAVLTGLTSGLYNIAVNNYSYNAERAETYYYSYPYDKLVYYFVQRPDDEPLTSFQDIADRGYSYEAASGNSATTALERWNEEHPDSQIELVYSESDVAVMFEHVEDGLFNFRIHEAPIYFTYKEQFGFDLVGYPIAEEEVHSVISSADCSYFMFPKTEEGKALRDEVNTVLKELWEEGVLAELGVKYFGVDQSPTAEDFETVLN